MAVVYLAEDLRHGRQVAVKVVRPEVLIALGPERFQREIAVAARLSHPHIIPLFDSGIADGLVFFVMPHVSGESLRERLARECPLPIDEAVKIGRDVASALAYAHAQGIIHRDIKPENILLEGGEARVADFGIARAISGIDSEAITTSGLVVGTPLYMSPEQASGAPKLDPRSDLYALGTVLYEMLGGEPPFAGVSPQAILARQSHDTPTPITVLREAVPAPLADLVHRMLKKVPADRPGTAEEVVRALETSSTPLPAPVPASRRRPYIAWLALGGILVAGALGWWMTRPAPPGDPNRVAVFPLAPSPGNRDSLRATDITGALVSALNSSGVINAVELPLGPGDDPARVARAAGAGRWITGSLYEADSLRVIFQVRPWRPTAAPPRPVVLRAASEPWEVAYAAAGPLLRSLMPRAGEGDQASLPLLRGRSPAALAHFYQGDASYRHAAFADALAQFRAALAEDSTFAFAALRGAQAASWVGDTLGAEALLGQLGRGRDSLPFKYASFARGLQAYQEGLADTAVARFREVLAQDPYSPDAWMALGEVYAHLLPLVGSIDTLAENMFQMVHTLDPDFAPALPHLIEAALRRGDSTATTLLSAFAAAQPEAHELRYLQLAVQCVLGRRQVAWSADTDDDSNAAFEAAQVLSAGGLRQPACADAAWRAVDSARLGGARGFAALMMRQDVLIDRGDTTEARVRVELDSSATRASKQLLLALDAIAGAPEDSAASSLADSVLFGLAHGATDISPSRLWIVGVWLSHEHRVADAARVRDAAVRRLGSASPMARSLDARVRLAQGDTTGAVTILAANPPAARKSALSWRPNESLVADRMLLAELYLARGQPWDAIEWASVVDAPAVLADLVFLPASLRIRATAADAAGDQQLAQDMRQRLAALSPGTVKTEP